MSGRLLILGGTGEAASLARAVMARFGDRFEVITALAGRTRRPGPIAGNVRIGGFGGAEGLAAYLREAGIERLIDATHPFAAEISAAARTACDTADVPRLILLRPPWRRHPLDRWIEVDSVAGAASVVALFDRRVVNESGVDGGAESVGWFGFRLKFLQTGKIPNYALGMAVGVVALALIAFRTS